MVQQKWWNSNGGTLVWWNRNGGTEEVKSNGGAVVVEQLWWNSNAGKVMVEQLW